MSLLNQHAPSFSLTPPSARFSFRLNTPRCGILIIDHEEVARTLLGLYLRQQKIPVWLASDGEEAREIYQQYRDEIVVAVLSLHMPNGEGPFTLHQLKDINPDLVGYFMKDDLEADSSAVCAEGGAAGVLQKPFFFSTVAKNMQRYLDNHEQMLDLNAVAHFANPYLREMLGHLPQYCRSRSEILENAY